MPRINKAIAPQVHTTKVPDAIALNASRLEERTERRPSQTDPVPIKANMMPPDQRIVGSFSIARTAMCRLAKANNQGVAVQSNLPNGLANGSANLKICFGNKNIVMHPAMAAQNENTPILDSFSNESAVNDAESTRSAGPAIEVTSAWVDGVFLA